MTLDHVVETAESLLRQTEKTMEEGKSPLPYEPDEAALKALLVSVLETQYGSLSQYGWRE